MATTIAIRAHGVSIAICRVHTRVHGRMRRWRLMKVGREGVLADDCILENSKGH